MKHILPFVLFEAKAGSLPRLTKKQEGFLNRYTQGTWSVNRQTSLVDVEGSFNCIGKRLKTLSGISFGHVSGNFYCSHNQLTSLEGAPETVNGYFYCSHNQLTSLEGAPETVNGYFNCQNNQLTSLAGAPRTVDGNFWCYNNRLTSLEGAPLKVGGDFYCFINQLTSLEGAPQTVGGGFYCDFFELGRGEWNMEGWLKVLNTGTEEAKRLILTLPWLQSDWWNSRLKEKPQETTLLIVTLWDDFPKETQDRIQIPSNWKDSFDNLLDLQRAGIF